MRIGLDFGTTNSSAALFHDGNIQFMKSSVTQADGILPSLLYITRDHEYVVGRKAAERYLADDTGRHAIWETREAGILEYWVTLGEDPNPTLIQQELYVQEDINANGRLLRSIKTALRNPNYAGTAIFDKHYTIQALIAIFLKQLYNAAEKTLGQPAKSVLMGRPVTITGTKAGDLRAESILRAAAREAGFQQVDFMYEPIAAAYSYQRFLPNQQTALIFDFGGGTLDLTLARLGEGNRPRILANHGVLIGGDDFDRRIMEKFLLTHFGEDQLCEGKRLPFQIFEHLTDWSRHPDLTRGDLYQEIRYAAHQCHHIPEFPALESLIDNKYGYKLFDTIEHAKIQLSHHPSHPFSFRGDQIAIDAVITQERFSRSIRAYCQSIDEAISTVLDQANLNENAVDAVIRTGGSSQVPAVVGVLAKRFGEEKIASDDPFLSIVSGLAIAATEDDEQPQSQRIRDLTRS